MIKLFKYLIIFFLLNITLLARENNDTHVTLQLKWFNSFQFAGYYMAVEKGYYKDVGLDVTIVERDPSKNNIQQVLDGEADYGVADSTILLWRAKNRPVKILASIFQHSPLIFLSKKSSGIVSPYEMKGKILSFERELDDAPLLAILKEANIGENDYTYKSLDLSHKDFIDSKVDVISAYITDEPFSFRELGIEVNIINPLNYGIDFYGDNLFTTQSEIDKHPDRVNNFTKASIKGWKYALENKEEAIRVIKEKYKSTYSIEHLSYEADETEKMMLTDIIDIGYTSIDRFKRIALIYQNIGKINASESEIALKELIYNPNELDESYKNYLYLIMLLLLLFMVSMLIFGLFNRHLKSTVKKRTQDLMQQQSTVDKYVIMVETDEDGVILHVSKAFCDISGYEKFELVGKRNSILKHPDTPNELYESLWSTIKSGDCWTGEIINLKKDGTPYHLSLNIDISYDSNGVKTGYRSIMKDITSEKLAQELAITDSLTKVHNRLHIDRVLAKEIQRARRHKRELSIILMDVDNFKSVNDIYGHQTGDIVLIEVSKILKENIRSTDTLGRWGGEEFLIIVPDTDKQATAHLAQKIRKNIEEYEFTIVKSITGSFGISAYSLEDSDDSIIKKADEALYLAKKSGKNRVEIR